MNPRKLFVAGSTGAVGAQLIQTAESRGIPFLPLVRPATAAKGNAPANAAVVEFSDRARLAAAMRGHSTVLQLIGTMRKRFKSGDTYEASDIGTTQQLVDAAKDAGVDHLVLLSSAGAGRPFGAYLKAKARAEQIVAESGIAFTILRPSAFIGAGHDVPTPFQWATEKLQWVRWKPILVEDLVDALLEAAIRRGPLNRALEGESLWELVRTAKRRLQPGAAADA